MRDISKIRTDLALEAREVWQENAEKTTQLAGVKSRDEQKHGYTVTTVSILDEQGEKALCKPIGDYITIELDRLIRREENAFTDCAQLLGEVLSSLLGELPGDKPVLIAGLGNAVITPDAIGPWAVDNVIVTRHLKQHAPKDFEAFRSVAALRSGVLGTTGIESARLISIVADELQPIAVIAIDALASRNMERLCRTLQITNTGIVPGSGVGNSREALSKATLGVPVIAIGVPTVVDAATLTAELAAHAGVELPADSLQSGDMIVTPRDIDRSARDAAKLVGYGVNLALHKGLTVADIDMLLS
ncbi:MAG: GPR endopeptidase [Oscillospiraceae bacterium]